ncbi:hypothetical protein ACVWZK_001692 [Bradyrhizobium sp. GM0.4]
MPTEPRFGPSFQFRKNTEAGRSGSLPAGHFAFRSSTVRASLTNSSAMRSQASLSRGLIAFSACRQHSSARSRKVSASVVMACGSALQAASRARILAVAGVNRPEDKHSRGPGHRSPPAGSQDRDRRVRSSANDNLGVVAIAVLCRGVTVPAGLRPWPKSSFTPPTCLRPSGHGAAPQPSDRRSAIWARIRAGPNRYGSKRP